MYNSLKNYVANRSWKWEEKAGVGGETSGRHYMYLNRDLRVKTRLNIELPYDAGIPVLGIYPRELKTCLHKKIVL